MIIQPLNLIDKKHFNIGHKNRYVQSFKSNENKDSFEKNMHSNSNCFLTERLLNNDRYGKHDLAYTEALLNEIYEKVITRNTQITKYEHSVGAHIQKHAIRSYLLMNLPNATPYFITILEHEIDKKLLRKLGKKYQPEKMGYNLKSDTTDSQETRGEKNHFLTLELMYKHNSLKFTQEYLKPYIKKELELFSLNDIESLIKNLYEISTRHQKFSYSLEKNNGVIIKSFLDNEPFIEEVGSNKNNAKSNLFNKILNTFNVTLEEINRPTNIRRVRYKYTGNENAAKSLSIMLRDIGFFNEDEKLEKYKDGPKLEYLSRSIDLSMRMQDEYRFQTLEFYGDSIINILVGRFLVEKNISKEDTTHYYSILSNNRTLAQNIYKCGLYKYLKNFSEKEITYKLMADAFEALVGALALSFSEDKLYNFLKPFFEENFQKVQENNALKNKENTNHDSAS